MKSKNARQPNKLVRIISMPGRALSKARDFYVKSMNGYADRITCGAVHGPSQISGLPKSFSARAYNDEDLRELVRASSGRSFKTKVDGDSYIKPQMNTRSGGPRAMPPRSSSVAMGRIDEERPCCYFSEDHTDTTFKNHEINYSRSKSHAFLAKRIGVF